MVDTFKRIIFDLSLKQSQSKLNNMKRYHITIQTDDNSISLCDFDTKKEALKEAAYRRGGGIAWRNSFSAAEKPHIEVYDSKMEKTVYYQPMFKYALKG